MSTQQIANRIGALQAPQLDYILVDGSASMQSTWYDCLAALDGFMDTLRSQNINSHGIVHVFDSHNMKMIQRDGIIGDWQTFSSSPLSSSWGGTPLYDAINLMGRELRDLDPPRASIVIVTDGADLNSRHTTPEQARAILDWCRAKGWQVTFLGADFNNARQAALLGATPANMIAVRREKLDEAGRVLGQKRVRNAISGTDINFSDEEKENFGGYLSHDPGGK